MSVAFEADTWGMFVRRADRFGVQLTDVLSIYFFFPCPFHSKNLRRLVNLKKKICILRLCFSQLCDP